MIRIGSYASLFILVGLESLGIPLPGETALLSAAALAALGHLSIWAVVGTATAGAVIGDNAGYWIGRRWGIALLRRYGRVLHLDESHLERARGFFDRHGAKAVFFGRFIALLRTWAAVLAGVGRMPYRTFMLYNALGAACWSALFGALGYTFARALPQLERSVGRAGLAGALLVTLVVALALTWRWFGRNSAGVAAGAQALWQRILSTPGLRRLRERYPRAWTFAVARFAPGEYLGLHLTMGLVVSLAGLSLFGGITEDVLHHDPLTQFDVTLLEWLHARATPTGYAIAEALSFLGSPWMLALAGGGLLQAALKSVIRRPRPPYAAAFLGHYTWSFPSGHAMVALIGYGMLAYVLVVLAIRRRAFQIAVVVGAALLIVAVGLSRLYLGVHYFSDVVGGYAAGVLWLSGTISGVEVARRWRVGA